MSCSHVYIVGAGFSKYAGLPLQADFTEALLEPRKDEQYPMRPLIHHLDEFVNKAFDHKLSAKARFWPALEDVFTNIDMAANTGHHLGSYYPPSKLRTTRRVLLARMMCMLDERFTRASELKDEAWRNLDAFFARAAGSKAPSSNPRWVYAAASKSAGAFKLLSRKDMFSASYLITFYEQRANTPDLRCAAEPCKWEGS